MTKTSFSEVTEKYKGVCKNGEKKRFETQGGRKVRGTFPPSGGQKMKPIMEGPFETEVAGYSIFSEQPRVRGRYKERMHKMKRGGMSVN